MNKILSAISRSSVIAALIYLVLGLCLVIFPETSGSVICYIIAALLLLDGIRHIISYFSNSLSEVLGGYDLALGGVEVLLGVFVLIRPATMLSLLPICLGLALVISGVIRLQRSFDLKRAGAGSWKVVLILGALVAALGLLMLVNPFATAKVLMVVLGVSLMVDACCMLLTAWCLKQLSL